MGVHQGRNQGKERGQRHLRPRGKWVKGNGGPGAAKGNEIEEGMRQITKAAV